MGPWKRRQLDNKVNGQQGIIQRYIGEHQNSMGCETSMANESTHQGGAMEKATAKE